MAETITLEDNFVLTVSDQGTAVPTAHADTHAAGDTDPLTLTLVQISDAGTMASQNKGTVDIEGGTIDNTPIGGTTKAAGGFTTLVVTGAVTLTSALPVLQGGTGSNTQGGARSNLGLGDIATQNANGVTLTGGTINNVIIGGSTPLAGTFTAVAGTTGTFSGNVTVAGTLGVTGTLTGAAASFTTGGFSGNATVGGTLVVTGAVSGPSATFTAVAGATGTFSGAVSAASLTLTTELAVLEGGTGAGTPAGARTNLGFGSGQVALAGAGTIAVADTAIATGSVVTVTHLGTGSGTPGKLSVALNAGVGFTINSDSASDNNTVAYIVVY